MASFMARVYLQRASDAAARDLGMKEVDGFPREGAQVAFAHDGKMVLGKLHANRSDRRNTNDHRALEPRRIMTIYRAYLVSPAGKFAAVQRLSADDDDMAVAFVRDAIKRSRAIGSFELWQGTRRIEASRKKSRSERGGASQSRRP